MKVLGFDTATRATAVAVLDRDTGAIRERRDDPPGGARPRHTSRLLPLAAQALADAGTDWSGVDLIAVGTGPGTYTGIRIGVASARALAAAHGIPIAGVSTLRALAAGAAGAADDGELVLAVLDARRGEVFVAGWRPDEVGRGDAEPVLSPRALAPGTLAEALAAADGQWLAVGDGALAHRAQVEATGARVPHAEEPLHRVSAAAICRLGLVARAGAADGVRPDYLREPDATPPATLRGGGSA
ncbi:MAG TPA: tRNA (adenosine(37)-N6)-threonylcarbamoyltransferase complex dimerization subunit type 1 TsaB [Solirubrobacteraceae bacterium]|nr:tRNA (adenosine(37)-N6)-threonylcarbamoyltransferase complex dimerization subunit type 1 TsaB [Solirubrobacteraceae bacterium]